MENLARLAAKPGVQSTLVLSKADGSIIRSSGLLASPVNPTSPETPTTGDGLDRGSDYPPSSSLNIGNSFGEHSEGKDRGKNAEHVAKMVFAFLSAANDFADGMEKGDNMQLVRMRSRKNEVVIVPGEHTDFSHTPCDLGLYPRSRAELTKADTKFILVVIHDAPQA